MQSIPEIKQQIWHLSGQNLDKVNKSIAATSHRSDTVEWWQRVLIHMQTTPERKAAKKPKPRVSDEVYKRYRDAKYQYESINFPTWVKDGHFIEPEKPKDDSNGIQNFIEDYLTWTGHFANRTGNEGRVLKDGTRIKSSSKNGMQDMDCNLKHPSHPFGIPWKIEVKAGKDTHKEHQKKYGEQVAKTGGVYSVVRSCEDFLRQLDELLG